MKLPMGFVFDWTKGRQKGRKWQPHSPINNIFNGKFFWDKYRLDNIDIHRLSILPAEISTIANSFTVIATDTEWSKTEKPKLPFDFNWQQSLPGRFDFYFKLAEGQKCMGLGERYSGLNVRGEKHTIVTTDDPHHSESMQAMYKAIPFLLTGKDNQFTGIYIDTGAPTRFDLDSELTGQGRIEVLTRRGFHVYIIGSSSMPNIVKAFTHLVGRSKLPSLWSLGHQQSRWSYFNEESVIEVAGEIRRRKIPCDTIVFDLDFMDEYRVFTRSPERFPNFNKIVADLSSDNFRVVTSVDPGVKEDPEYGLYKEGKDKNMFCKTPDGELFVEKVWPGRSVFPDFLRDDVRKWWAEKQAFLSEAGVTGIWNDMNEPAFFDVSEVFPEKLEEMSPAKEQLCVHQAEDGTIPHLEARNVYGLLMSQAAYEGLLAKRPNERPFVLSRSGAAGIQRYAAVWLGDNKSWYEHLNKSIPMLLNMGLSGVPFAGVDIGGFWHDCLPELLVRWYEVGIFYPFFRNHTSLGSRAQEIFSYVPKIEEMGRKLIETRYSLLPYIRNLFWEHIRTGAPLMRPLSWHYPLDSIAADIDDQFMFGQDILVSPILSRGHDYRPVYLPEGNWYRFETGEKFAGNSTYTIRFPLGSVPAFVREGAILPIIEPMQHTNEYHSKSIIFKIFADEAACSYFEDDGISFDYEKGAYNEYLISYSKGKLNTTTVKKGYASEHKYSYQKMGESKVQPLEL